MPKQILIDADTGIDDSIAILFALKRPDVRVMGVTTGFGNTTARQAAENSLRLIRLAGVPYEVPVAVGATEPLAGNWKGRIPHPRAQRHRRGGAAAFAPAAAEGTGLGVHRPNGPEHPGELTCDAGPNDESGKGSGDEPICPGC